MRRHLALILLTVLLLVGAFVFWTPDLLSHLRHPHFSHLSHLSRRSHRTALALKPQRGARAAEAPPVGGGQAVLGG